MMTYDEFFEEAKKLKITGAEMVAVIKSSRSPVCSMTNDKNIAIRDLIMRDICELVEAEQHADTTVCVNYNDVYKIVSDHLELEESH